MAQSTPMHDIPLTQFYPTANPNQNRQLSSIRHHHRYSYIEKVQGNGHSILLNEVQGKTEKKSFIGNKEAKTWGVNSRNITHHITIGKFVLRICIWKIPHLKLIIRLCTNGPMLCSRQSMRLKSQKSIRLKSRQTVLLCKGVIMSHVRTDTQIPQQ